MVISMSQILLAIHTIFEAGAGITSFVTGTAPDGVKKQAQNGTYRLWKRWHACGWLAMAHVGYLGMTDPSFKRSSIKIITPFHVTATIAVILAAKEKTISWKDATIYNIHFYLALGFFALNWGVLE